MTVCPCPLLLEASTVAGLLSVGLDDAERLIDDGAIATVTIAGQQRVPRAELERFVEALPRQAPRAPAPPADQWLTQPQLARRLGVSHSTITRLVRLGRIPHRDVGGGGGRRRDGIRFAPADVAAIESGPYLPQIEYSRAMAEVTAKRRPWTPDLRVPPPLPDIAEHAVAAGASAAGLPDPAENEGQNPT